MKLKLIQAHVEANGGDFTPEYEQAAAFEKWLDDWLKGMIPRGYEEIISTELAPRVSTYDTDYMFPGVLVFSHLFGRTRRIAYFIFTDDGVVWYTDASDEEAKHSYKQFYRRPSDGEPSMEVKADLRDTIMNWVQED